MRYLPIAFLKDEAFVLKLQDSNPRPPEPSVPLFMSWLHGNLLKTDFLFREN